MVGCTKLLSWGHMLKPSSMAILANLVPFNGDRLIIYGGGHPIVGDLVARVSHVGHGRRSRHGQSQLRRNTHRGIVYGMSKHIMEDWGEGDAVLVGGEIDMVGGL
eukprot:scaffold86575_cov62-Attheya_sp.AAC.1